MKALILAFSIIFSCLSFAQQRVNVSFNGARSTKSVHLESTVYKKQITERVVTGSCYSNDCYGYGGYGGGYGGYGGYGGGYYGRGYGGYGGYYGRGYGGYYGGYNGCYTRYYSCDRVERVKANVFDHNVQADIMVNFKGSSSRYNGNLSVRLDNGKLNFSATGSNNILVVASGRNINRLKSGNTVYITGTYDIKFINNKSFNAAANAGVRNISLKGKTVSFNFNKYQSSLSSSVFIKVVRIRGLAANRVVFKKTFNAGNLSKNGYFSQNLSSYGAKIGRGKYNVTVQVMLNTGGIKQISGSRTFSSSNRTFKRR